MVPQFDYNLIKGRLTVLNMLPNGVHQVSGVNDQESPFQN